MLRMVPVDPPYVPQPRGDPCDGSHIVDNVPHRGGGSPDGVGLRGRRPEDRGRRPGVVRHPGHRRQAPRPGGLQGRQARRAGVHVQSLPDRHGLRGPPGGSPEGLPAQGRSGRRGERQQHRGGSPGGDEEAGHGEGIQLPLPVRRDAEDGPRLRRNLHAPRVRARRGAEGRLHGRDRRQQEHGRGEDPFPPRRAGRLARRQGPAQGRHAAVRLRHPV
jgi:hypothetical protein